MTTKILDVSFTLNGNLIHQEPVRASALPRTGEFVELPKDDQYLFRVVAVVWTIHPLWSKREFAAVELRLTPVQPNLEDER